MRLTKLKLGAVFALFAFVSAVFGQLPSTLTFVSAGPASITIVNVHYDSGVTAPGPLHGTGDLVFNVAGSTFTDSGQAFTGIFADSSGNVSTGKAGYTFTKDIPWTNMMGSHLTATLKAPIAIVVESSGGSVKTTLSADAQCQLPFRDSVGNQATFSAKGSKLVFDGGASSVLFDTNLVAAGAPEVQAAGFGITMDSPHLTVQSPAKPLLSLSSSTIKVSTPIPSVFADGPMSLTAKNFAISETGLPSFDSLALGSDSASLDPAPLSDAAIAGHGISLVQPVNFGLELTAASGSVANGQIKDLKLTGNLVFPDAIKSEDRPSEPASVPISYSMSDRKFVRVGSGDVKLLWQPASGGPTLHLDIKSFTLDMAKGLTNMTASLRVDGDDRLTDASGGKSVSFDAKDATIDGNGLTGTVGMSGGLKVFGLTVKQGTMTFDRDVVVGGAFTGSLDIPSMGPLGFGIGISQDGANVLLQSNQSLKFPGLGAMTITSGSGAIDKANQVTFSLTGEVSVDILDNAKLGFTDLQVGSDGHITAGEIVLAKPVSIPLYGLTLVANKFVYTPQPQSIRIDGDIKFPDSLPVSGDVGFEGLTIAANAPPKVGKISFNASIAGVGTLSGMFEGSGSHPDQGFKNTLEGSVSANLDVLGGAGLACKILIADGGAWLVGGKVDLPPPGIILPVPPPPSPPMLSIYEFGVGLGHDVALRPGVDYDPNDPFKRYRYQDGGGFLIEGSVGFSTTDDFLAWGPLTMDVVTNPLQIALSGDFALMTVRGAMPYDPNRSAHMVMGYFGDGFELHGNLVFKLPILFSLTGGVDAKFGTDKGYIYVGWPIKDRGITNTVGLPGVLASTSKMGVGLDLYPKFMIQAGIEEGVQLAIVKGRRWLNLGFAPSVSDTHVHFDVGVEGEVDFLVASLSASAEASDDFDIGTSAGFHNTLRGRFTASLNTFLGDVTVHAEGDILSW